MPAVYVQVCDYLSDRIKTRDLTCIFLLTPSSGHTFSRSSELLLSIYQLHFYALSLL